MYPAIQKNFVNVARLFSVTELLRPGILSYTDYPSSMNVDDLLRQMQNLQGGRMKDIKRIFPTWPIGVMEKWAVEFHDEFIVEYEHHYDMEFGGTKMSATVYGVPNVGLLAYRESHDEYKTMKKLQENL